MRKVYYTVHGSDPADDAGVHRGSEQGRGIFAQPAVPDSSMRSVPQLRFYFDPVLVVAATWKT